MAVAGPLNTRKVADIDGICTNTPQKWLCIHCFNEEERQTAELRQLNLFINERVFENSLS